MLREFERGKAPVIASIESFSPPSSGAFKRGYAPLPKSLPLPLIKGKGDKGG